MVEGIIGASKSLLAHPLAVFRKGAAVGCCDGIDVVIAEGVMDGHFQGLFCMRIQVEEL
jgi:hypothetical protein